jgi:hypothetical protein
MAKCREVGCFQETRGGGNKYCKTHDPNSKENLKLAGDAQKKAAAAAVAKKVADDRLQAIHAKLARDRLAAERAAEKLRQIRAQANVNLASINRLVAAVTTQRALHPAIQGINAGTNPGNIPTIQGGTNNPYSVSGAGEVSAGEVLTYMVSQGQLEQSDSGAFKHRAAGGIFIHVG